MLYLEYESAYKWPVPFPTPTNMKNDLHAIESRKQDDATDTEDDNWKTLRENLIRVYELGYDHALVGISKIVVPLLVRWRNIYR